MKKEQDPGSLLASLLESAPDESAPTEKPRSKNHKRPREPHPAEEGDPEEESSTSSPPTPKKKKTTTKPRKQAAAMPTVLKQPPKPKPKRQQPPPSRRNWNKMVGEYGPPAVLSDAPPPKSREEKAAEDLEALKARHAELNKEANKTWRFPEKHHIYVDPSTMERFDIKLVQINHMKDDEGKTKNNNDLVNLRLYESNGTPATYATYMEGPTKKMPKEILVPVGSSWETAFGALKEQFELFTGRNWAQRMLATRKWPAEMEGREELESPYIYTNITHGY